MANEIRATYNTGANLYTLVFNAAGQVYYPVGGAFETYGTGGHVQDDYDIVLSEVGTTGQYRGTFPVVAAGVYSVVMFLRIGASPASTDTIIGSTGEMHWDGAAEIDASALHTHETTIEGYTDILDDATNGNAAIKAEVEGIGGVAMRGTDGAALATVCTEARLAELDAGTPGKAAAEIDIMKVDVAGLDGAAMRGTDNAALASVCTEIRLGKLDATISSRSTPAEITTAEGNIRGADSDTLKTLSDQADLQGTLANQTTLLARIGAFTVTGANTIFGFLKGLMSKAASTPSDVGGTFSAATDSTEAIQEKLATVETYVQRIGTASVNVVAPVASDGDITIIQGDDYLDADSRALEWQNENWTTPSLVGATGKLRLVVQEDYDVGDNTKDLEVSVAVSMDGTTAVFKVDLTAAQTAALAGSPPGDKYNYTYQLQVITSGGKKLTIAIGSCYVQQEVA